jgi:hypothetical protein
MTTSAAPPPAEHPPQAPPGVVKGQPDRAATSPLGAIRLNCLDCCGGSFKAIKFCTLDGANSTRCPLWPFRFGKRPSTIRRGPLAKFLNPEQMPTADVALEDCR